MTHTVTLSEQLHNALQKRAQSTHTSPDSLVEQWVRERLDLEQYAPLEWRRGPSGWRVGIKGTAIDVHTVVGYSQVGYTPQEIAEEILPALSLTQIHTALRYYADFPDEIDEALSRNDPDMSKARLYRSLGPTLYYQVTGSSTPPHIIADAQPPYQDE